MNTEEVHARREYLVREIDHWLNRASYQDKPYDRILCLWMADSFEDELAGLYDTYGEQMELPL